ncbi:MAG: hypothetical protein Q9187_007961 [Circinaria calcarea]
MSMAKLLEQRSHIIPGKLKVSELFFEVPKDHSKPEDGLLRLFARSVERVEKPVDPAKEEVKRLPWCGPGMPCRPPQNCAWVNPILEKGYQVLFLDQRGAGLSTTITAQTLAKHGGAKEQAAYLKNFRADSIVKDCEAIRKTLTQDYPENKKKWTIMGQSFGGFCCLNYLSRFPEGLQEVFIVGGLAPLVRQPDALYVKLLKKVAERSRKYYEKYPEDVKRVHDIAQYLAKESVKLPSGTKLNPMHLRQLGMYFGGHGKFLVYKGYVIVADMEKEGWIWCMVGGNIPLNQLVLITAASNWSAERMMAQLPEFQYSGEDRSKPIFFTAEMILKDMYTTYDELVPLRETAELLAQDADWPDLYDEAVLAENEVPVYAATYYDDLYVDFEYAQETAARIKGCKQYITNAMYHNALGTKAEEVVKQLFALRDDVID